MGKLIDMQAEYKKCTPKQEAFAREVAKGSTNSEAYRLIYDADNSSPETIHREAARLMALPHVAHRVSQFMKELELRMIKDGMQLREHVIGGLFEMSNDRDVPPATRVRAFELLGKVDIVGLFEPKAGGKDERLEPEKIKAELEEKLVKLIGKDTKA